MCIYFVLNVTIMEVCCWNKINNFYVLLAYEYGSCCLCDWVYFRRFFGFQITKGFGEWIFYYLFIPTVVRILQSSIYIQCYSFLIIHGRQARNLFIVILFTVMFYCFCFCYVCVKPWFMGLLILWIIRFWLYLNRFFRLRSWIICLLVLCF